MEELPFMINRYFNKNRHLKTLFILLSLFWSSVSWTMAEPQSGATIATLSDGINSIRLPAPVSTKPFQCIPSYVYKNCNQVTYYQWSEEHLQRLKKAVGTITPEALKQKYNGDKYIEAAEAYDWIHCLNLIERKYLSLPYITLEAHHLQEINGALTRLTSKNPGAWRTQSMKWDMKEFSPAEHILFQYIDQQDAASLLSGRDRFLRFDPETAEVPVEDIARLLQHFDDIAKQLEDFSLKGRRLPAQIIKSGTIDMNELQEWVKEQEHIRKKNPNALNIKYWVEQRIHRFPDPELLPIEIANLLRGIKMSPYHPVIKAAIAWYEIVRIHPWNEAHKRTGKVIASLILLQNGYLPPLITKEDAKEFVGLMLHGFRQPKGHIPFIKFIIRMIEKTQETMKKEIAKGN